MPIMEVRTGRAGRRVIGPFDLTELVQKMVTDRAAWEAVASFAGRVLRKKAEAERREQNEGRSAHEQYTIN